MNGDFVRTHTVLDRILGSKAQAVAEMRSAPGMLAKLQEAAYTAVPPRDFTAALQGDMVALIAEVKKASPSKGVLVEDFDPAGLAAAYAQNGAAAISVLTDGEFFQGSLDNLKAVRAVVDVPVLMKDFIIDPCQVYAGRAAGADAALLIVAALTDSQLAELHVVITALQMVALVEVHNLPELERALKVGAALIGINNRNLKTFDVDIETTARLARFIPKGVTLVAESGLRDDADVYRMGQVGAHAVLIGESLVTSGDVGAKVRELSAQKREVGR